MSSKFALENMEKYLESILTTERRDEYDERIREYLYNKRYERTEANYRILRDACERLRGKLNDLLRSKDRTYDEKEEEIKKLSTRLRALEEKLDQAVECLWKEGKRKHTR